NPSLNPTPSTNPNPKGRNRRSSKQRIEGFNLDELSPPIVMMADQRTMAQLLQAPIEGYEDAIVVPAITVDNFELKHGLLTLVQNKQFFRHDKEDPHAHIRYFNMITSTLKFPNVSNTSIKLMLFPFSLEGAAQIWLEKEPPRSIFTWDDLRFDESFSEAWDRFKDLLRACPHHGFSELHQLDTFYNSLNSKDQDSLNSAAGVAELKDMVKALLLDKKSQNHAPSTVKAVEESFVTCGGAHSYHNCPATNGNVYRENIQEFISQASTVNYNQGNTNYCPLMMSNQIRPPGFPPVPNNQNVQRNNQNRFNQNQNRGNKFNHGPVYQPPVFQPPAYQAPAYQAPAPQTQGVSKENFLAYVKANDAVMRNMQTQAITTRSGVSYDGPQIPPPSSFLPKVVENEPKATKDTVYPTNNESTEDVQPPVVQSKSLILTSEPINSPTIEPVISPAECLDLADLGASINLMPLSMWNKLYLPDLTPTCMTLELADRSISRPVGVAEDVYVKVGSFHFLADFVVVDFDADPRVPLILWRSFLKTERALIDVFEGELTLRVGKEAITFNLDQTSRYSANCNEMTAKQIDIIDMACEEYS
nr:reverse transcriptase domain-containing protein [Tanacetum cinerariifolium]